MNRVRCIHGHKVICICPQIFTCDELILIFLPSYSNFDIFVCNRFDEFESGVSALNGDFATKYSQLLTDFRLCLPAANGEAIFRHFWSWSSQYVHGYRIFAFWKSKQNVLSVSIYFAMAERCYENSCQNVEWNKNTTNIGYIVHVFVWPLTSVGLYIRPIRQLFAIYSRVTGVHLGAIKHQMEILQRFFPFEILMFASHSLLGLTITFDYEQSHAREDVSRDNHANSSIFYSCV